MSASELAHPAKAAVLARIKAINVGCTRDAASTGAIIAAAVVQTIFAAVGIRRAVLFTHVPEACAGGSPK